MNFTKKQQIAIQFAFVTAFVIRVLLFPFTNLDLDYFVLPWYEFIQSHHGYPALKYAFTNYSPAYPTLLVLFSYLKFMSPLESIKIISVIFDFLNAWLAGMIVFRITNSPSKRIVITLLVLFSPVVILNSSFWGQCDGIYTFWILLSFYYLISEKSLPAVLSFGMALAFKFQAMFFAPLLLIYYLKTKKNLLNLLLTPIPYILTAIPTLLAGRSFTEVMLIYVDQSSFFRSLTMNAPNFYVFLPNYRYDLLVPAGIIATSIAFIVLFALIYFSKKPVSPAFWLRYAAFFLFLIPMVLPKMHDRYFYPAALFLLILAVVDWKSWYLGFGLQITSALTYTYFLTEDHQGWLPIEIVAFLQITLLGLVIWDVHRKEGLLNPLLNLFFPKQKRKSPLVY
ncbi:MAG: hypothetical protein CL609_20875 [Anaerolineaceae bacterium]|nr:hypothetical protein [Anaerolineaceae bacterium]